MTIPRRLLTVMAITPGIVLPLAFIWPLFVSVLQTVGTMVIPGIALISITGIRPRGLMQFCALVLAGSLALNILVFGATDLAMLGVGWSTPLAPWSLWLMQSTFWFGLAIAVHKFGDDVNCRMPGRLTTWEVLLLCAAVSAVVQSSAGALILNGGGTGFFAIAAYCFIAAVMYAVLLRPPATRDVADATVTLLAVALLLSNALRSPYLSARDINHEYQLASLVQDQTFWNPIGFSDSFMACLSSSLYPVALSNISGLPLLMVFKIALPAIFAFIAVFVLDFARTFVSERGALAAVLFFVVQPGFQQWISIPVRQEVAFLLLSVAIWALITGGISRRSRQIYFWLAIITTLLSHYSTIYVACIVFTLTVILFRWYSRRRMLPAPQERQVLTGIGVLMLAVGAVVWYGPVTTHTYAQAEFASYSVRDIQNLFDPSVQQNGQSAFSGFGLFETPPSTRRLIPEYMAGATADYKGRYGSSRILGSDWSSTSTKLAELDGPPVREPWHSVLPRVRVIAKVLALILVGVGFLVIWRRHRTKDLPGILAMSAFLSGVVLVLLPFISIGYDLMRLYQQLLLLLSPLLVIGARTIFSRHRRYQYALGATLLVAYFALLSRVSFQIAGGTDVSMTFNNRGWDYSVYYVSDTDVMTAAWLQTQIATAMRSPVRYNKFWPLVYADSAAAARIQIAAPIELQARLRDDLLPSTFVDGSYLFLDHVNISQKVTIKQYRNTDIPIPLVSPYRYFDRHLNRVYSTSDTAVYH
jgi:uncharacterized membrane protein